MKGSEFMKKIMFLILAAIILLTGCNAKKQESNNQQNSKVEEKTTTTEVNTPVVENSFSMYCLNSKGTQNGRSGFNSTIYIKNDKVEKEVKTVNHTCYDGRDANTSCTAIRTLKRKCNEEDENRDYYCVLDNSIENSGFKEISEVRIDRKLESASVKTTIEYEEEKQKDYRTVIKEYEDLGYSCKVDESSIEDNNVAGVYFGPAGEWYSNTEWWLFNTDGTWERQASNCEEFERYSGKYTVETYEENEVIKVNYDKYSIYLKIKDNSISYLKDDLPDDAPFILREAGCYFTGYDTWQKNYKLEIKYENIN